MRDRLRRDSVAPCTTSFSMSRQNATHRNFLAMKPPPRPTSEHCVSDPPAFHRPIRFSIFGDRLLVAYVSTPSAYMVLDEECGWAHIPRAISSPFSPHKPDSHSWLSEAIFQSLQLRRKSPAKSQVPGINSRTFAHGISL